MRPGRFKINLNDVSIGFAGASGNFELNVFRPVLALNVLQSIQILGDACNSFRKHTLEELRPNLERIKKNLTNSLMLVTALNPHIGYDKASEVANKAYEEDKTLREVIVDLGYMTEDEFDDLVQPEKMISPRKKINTF